MVVTFALCIVRPRAFDPHFNPRTPHEMSDPAVTLAFCTLRVREKAVGSLAERSKAPASGAGPKGREFESRSCHIF